MFENLIFNNKPYILITLIGFFVLHTLYVDADARITETISLIQSKEVVAFVAPVVGANGVTLNQENQTVGSVSPQEQSVGTPITVPRSNTGDASQTEEVSTSTPIVPIALPHSQNTFVFDDTWTAGYGSYSYTNNKLVIGGNLGHTASLMYLTGTEGLQNYELNAQLDWHRGSSVSIIARMQDFNNFVSCSFINSGKNAFIVNTVNGERFQSNSSPELPLKAIDAWKDLNFGVRVVGNTVFCLNRGEVVLKQTITNMPQTGSTGVSIWSAVEGEALVTVKGVTLTESN